MCMYCGILLTDKKHAHLHYKKVCLLKKKQKTKEDLEDELEFMNSEIEYNKLTTNSDRRIFRACVTPLYLLGSIPVGKHFKDSNDKPT